MRTLMTGWLILAAYGTAWAAVTVSAGDHTLAADTAGQTFQIMISTDSAEEITAATLWVQIGDGTAGNGDITNIVADIFAGIGIPTYFDGNVFGFPGLSAVDIMVGDPADDPVANGVLATVTIDTTGMPPGVYSLLIGSTEGGDSAVLQTGIDEPIPATFVDGSIVIPEAVQPGVAAIRAFYNNSAWDGNAAAANAADDDAIATDKSPLLPGQAPTFANVITYPKGINGLMVDIADLPGVPTGDDIVVQYSGVSNGGALANYSAGADPTTIAVRAGEGTEGSDRLTLVFPDSANKNSRWMRVTIRATANTGLEEDCVFYFGLAIGDTGTITGNYQVNTADRLAVRANPRSVANPAAVDFPYDINRDNLVNSTDQSLTRTYATNAVTDLQKIAEAP